MIDREYLREHPDHIFVFGDNEYRTGYGGAAKLRDFPNTYGFLTKRRPSHEHTDYYTPEEYWAIYYVEIEKLCSEIENNQDKTYLISKVGAGLANQYGIFEQIIEPNIKNNLSKYDNVRFLW